MAFVHHVARPDRIPRCWAAQRAKTMHIQPSITMVPLLATILVSPVVQAIGEPSSDARVIAAARAPRASCCSAGTDRPPTAHFRYFVSGRRSTTKGDTLGAARP